MMPPAGHNVKPWRMPPGEGFTLWAKCVCGWKVYAVDYDDLAVLVRDHFADAERQADVDAEEREHELHG